MAERRMIFIVEDDPKIAALLADYLLAAGYDVRIFVDGRSVVDTVRSAPPDAMILDLMLPVSDGMTICAAVRTFSAVPILMLTARVEERDMVTGLDRGADDYVTKPFSAGQVVARITALIRRSEGRVTADPTTLLYMVDDDGGRVAWRGNWLPLSLFEFRILAAMMKHPTRIFSRNQLLDHLGASAEESSDRAIDSHIKNIRGKIVAVDPDAVCVASVYGAGYRFDPG